ncbi:FliH/SctL family protein [Paenibacillus lemnae]|uniref:Flagellar assembly protein FliH n=1 Tax=Paenibacillus lemnae TaxID=1330551 RepID=A0A848M6B4_PAELE|nr:FliH/SctL family protein [Paenibacillus lemnae]NMO96156.1 flagellar assembly protein FliH [Paenibacillus lemnae]
MSNLIKPSQYMPLDVLKELDLAQRYRFPETEEDQEQAPQPVQPEVHYTLESAEQLKQEILRDAKEFAERQIREASEAAEKIMSDARAEISSWWDERRSQDEDIAEASKAEGYRAGYEEGADKARVEMQELLDSATQDAQKLLSQAYEAKEELIQEAEPFLVDLSCAIAEKIIERQLTIEPEYVLDLITKYLARKKEKGIISLCVAPTHFAFVHAAREELALNVDSQAELQILPDSTVTDRGCVIRSSLGSVDARIDTQLSEIKKELIRISMDGEERRNPDE